MNEFAVYSTIAFMLFLTGKLYLNYARKKNIVDTPNERSSHREPTIRGGGIIIFLAVLGWGLWEMVWNGTDIHFVSFITGFMLLGALGFFDDKFGISPQRRFPFQLVSVLLILYASGLWEADFHPIVKITAVIVSLGFVNAYNFMDGINGITGFYSLVLTLSFWYLNELFHLLPDQLFPLLLVSVSVFGYFNFRPKALMFAGDVGSMALAAVLLYISARFMIELKTPVLLLMLAVYGTDSAMTIIFRLLKKQNVFQAHRWHWYQKLVDRFQWPHLRVAMLYAGLQGLINGYILYFRLWEKETYIQFLWTGAVLLIFVTLYLILQKEKLFEKY